MEVINNHRSIRVFAKREIEDELLKSLLYSGTRASTTGNMQLYSVVVTREQKMKDKLSPLHFNQPAATNAPVLLTFVADFNRFGKWCKYREANPGYDNFLSFYTASIDALLVAQNVAIAAENSGLGICYLGTTTYNAAEIIEVLGLPELTFPVTTIAIGYPDETPGFTDRIPLDGIIHYEKYADYSEERIDTLFQKKEHLKSSKNFILENGKQTLAQVFTDIRYTKSDNEFFSRKFLKTLQAQGFLESATPQEK